MAKQEDDDDDFAVDSIDPSPREDGEPGPPDDWPFASWYDRQDNDWWWLGRRDPCPVRFLGYQDGQYFMISGAREIRRFTSGQLHGRGGVADLFGGSLWWPLRHFRKYDLEKKLHAGKLQIQRCMNAVIRACVAAGVYDGSTPLRSVGTWRGPDGRPIVHAGERIFVDGVIHEPGLELGDHLYVVGADRVAPSYVNDGRDGFEWEPAGPDAGRKVTAHLDEWHWVDLEARDLFQGGLFCDMLGEALRWKPHKFVRAEAGSGKSTMLKYARNLLGGAAHPIQRTFSKARLEDRFAHTACALLLEEAESDTDPNRIRQIFDLVLLLSDEGATGGRFKRDIDLHGIITMVATLAEDQRATIRTRMAYLELKPLRTRLNHPLAPLETVEAMIGEAHQLSAGLRARAIARFDLFEENLGRVRDRIIKLGGSPRDGDTLGHLVAGWWTMISDDVIDDDELGRLGRFKDYIVTLKDQEEGEDDASNLFNTLLGLPADAWRGGERLTIGQMIARAREHDNGDFRQALLPYGLRLEKLPNEIWRNAWLAVANKHPGLDRLFVDYPQYRGAKRAQILSSLRQYDGQEWWEVKPSVRPLRFAGPQARALLVPPIFLPWLSDEKDSVGPAPPEHGP